MTFWKLISLQPFVFEKMANKIALIVEDRRVHSRIQKGMEAVAGLASQQKAST